jgi:hypothetical protein
MLEELAMDKHSSLLQNCGQKSFTTLSPDLLKKSFFNDSVVLHSPALFMEQGGQGQNLVKPHLHGQKRR